MNEIQIGFWEDKQIIAKVEDKTEEGKAVDNPLQFFAMRYLLDHIENYVEEVEKGRVDTDGISELDKLEAWSDMMTPTFIACTTILGYEPNKIRMIFNDIYDYIKEEKPTFEQIKKKFRLSD